MYFEAYDISFFVQNFKTLLTYDFDLAASRDLDYYSSQGYFYHLGYTLNK